MDLISKQVFSFWERMRELLEKEGEVGDKKLILSLSGCFIF